MNKLYLRATILVVLFLVPKIVFGGVIINEVAWMGTRVEGVESKDWWRYEWLELYNDTDNPILLNGWKVELYRSTIDYTINLSGSISAKNYFLIVSSDKIPDYDLNYSNLGGKLNNGGERIILKDNQSNIVDDLDFRAGWLAGDNTTKQTMEKTSTDWQTSLSPGGTPKTQNSSGAVEEPEQTPETPEIPSLAGGNNPPIADAGDNIIAFVNQEIKFDGTKSSDPDGDELAYEWNMGDGKLVEKPSFSYAYPFPGTYLISLMVYDARNYVSDTITVKIQSAQIAINEFLPNPSGKDEEEEWIEIYNDSDSITDISGWQLDDIASGSRPFVFPQNTLIAPKSYIVFTRQVTGIALNNDKDSLRLLMPEGVVFQEINYQDPPMGKSSAHTDEGFVWNIPSPGTPNLAGITVAENKNTIYQNPIKPEITKESAKDYVVNYQNANKPEIEGGYIAANTNNQETITKTSELASAKQPLSNQSPLNLVVIIIAIVFGAGFIGLLLIKFRQKNLIIK